MLDIQGKLVSLDIIEKKFVCDLTACKGACCVEGDSGAPLEPAEAQWLDSYFEEILPYLDDEGRDSVLRQRTVQDQNQKWSTPLKKDQACIYSIRSESGVLKCGIEQAYLDGAIDFIKPISCHLYPIRVNKEEITDWEVLNFDRWDICNPACKHGEKLKVPVYKFLKIALIRKYGTAFYDELEVQAHQWLSHNSSKT